MKDQFNLLPLDDDLLETCVDLFIETFSLAPWNDVYESRDQVAAFFKRHMNNNYFLGYALKLNEEIVALSIGFQKPWIKGMEYYIDEFCVKDTIQHKGIGSQFLALIEADIKDKQLNAILLNTNKGFPAERFYLKNGFEPLADIVVLAK
ncbi:GNAT family N-acetyltransferase [Beduini massiliensis]|uniref:GNAT family N-acetyltransferase n=1 Tax=Beduini massiliensis TaxID=1585974 RepID=UPI00059A7A07|nr:GNAT family N-acetyltransferase [Beduini massiliensis]